MGREKQKIYDVATFGIGAGELEILRRIFVVSADRTNTFRLVTVESSGGRPDIMMLDRETPSNVYNWANAHTHLATTPPTIILTQNVPESGRLTLRRPLIATRVLAVLDHAVMAIDSSSTSHDGAIQSVFEADDRDLVHGEQYRALVVDDSLSARKEIGAALEKVKIEACFAENGEQALSRLRSDSFHIVFLDVVMPGMDGFEVCKKIKRVPALKHIPVVMLTASSAPLDRVKGKMSGSDTYLAKPVPKDAFYQTLRKFLGKPDSGDHE